MWPTGLKSAQQLAHLSDFLHVHLLQLHLAAGMGHL
jgi:hypothetical protein